MLALCYCGDNSISTLSRAGFPLPKQNHMNTKIEWTFGNFDIEVDVEAPQMATPAVAAKILAAAALQVLQRKPAGEVEKALAGYDKRPEGFKRDSIPFTSENALVVEEGFTLASDLGFTAQVTSVIEHVKGVVADSKFTEEVKIMGRHESASDLTVWLKDTVGHAGESHGADGNFSVEALRAVRAFKINALKGL